MSTSGLVLAAEMAGHWAGIAEARAGGRGQRVRDRLRNLLSQDDMAAYDALIAGETARAFETTYQHQADVEPTDPEAFRMHECANCGASVPVLFYPPRG